MNRNLKLAIIKINEAVFLLGREKDINGKNEYQYEMQHLTDTVNSLLIDGTK